jgi:phosphoglycolate phosphatase-like HAD superfamily hydrolase
MPASFPYTPSPHTSRSSSAPYAAHSPSPATMHLIMFDLDGTLVDSNAIDSGCYLQALVDVFGFDLARIDRNWANYPHVTDAGILHSLCHKELDRQPHESELNRYRQRFLELLELAIDDRPLQQIAGARAVLECLNADANYAIALATGAWQQTALFKLERAELAGIIAPIACSDDAHARVDIMQRAYDRALTCYCQSEFETVTYIGDGIWDGIASRNLDYQFIGIGTGDRAAALLDTGAKCVFPDYRELDRFMAKLCE